MTPRTYSLIAGIIFSLVALLHALRLLRGWLAIGDAVRLSITVPCPRCVMTTLSQGDLPIDNGILRTAEQPSTTELTSGSMPRCCRAAR